ncbi:orotate phosphoribosyltransferase [uncultured Umboniibacter sp.]|uniref:orotate phosphoribosyltransferase n=1 Tax=uncultured Umboniibacter sp. TaxID=1798917 RepID=UPI0026245AF4|nr:orotate phosphoribosyltransferase [uncultured Umboniibacter sp.]
MELHQENYLKLAIEAEALGFGQFTLKSGRISPYFFNAGKFKTGKTLALLGKAYAKAIVDSGVEYDVLFGPAYKGIPLAAATAVALATDHGIDIPWTFNRKEAKDHGEGGKLVGADIEQQRVLIIDDVITAGTAIREVIDILKANNASCAGVCIGLDRKERGHGTLSAIQEVEHDFNVPVLSIITIDHIIEWLSAQSEHQLVEKMTSYRNDYGV